MKILLIGDLHVGIKQDDPWIQSAQMDAIEQAIRISKENGVYEWLQLGDFTDVRRAVTHKTMKFAREIAEKLQEHEISVHELVGNHCMNLKDRIHPNFASEFMSQFDNFIVYDKPRTVTFGNVKFDIIPWICEENQTEIFEFIEKSESQYCVGHFEMSGFFFYKGLKSHGIEADFLKKYKRVFSGHFHTISSNKNVQYIGTPISLTAGDENDPRGFWIFDTETGEAEFIQNETMWHRRIDYPCNLDVSQFKNLSVRVFVTEVDDKLAEFESSLESVVHELKMVYKIDNSLEVSEDAEIDESITMTDLMNEYIDAFDLLEDNDKMKIKLMCNELYNEASQ